MTVYILGIACVILLCVFAEKFSDKFGMPALISFMFVGMLFGSDGILKIPFDNFELAENICAIALVFIMFYGGFNGNAYLSLYLFGIVIGNSRIRNKQMLIPFLMV